MNRFATVLAAALALALGACATSGDPFAQLTDGAAETIRTEANGDVVTEYRIDGRVRAVKIQPSRGPAFYLYDRDGDGVVDGDRNNVSPVYFKLFEWN